MRSSRIYVFLLALAAAAMLFAPFMAEAAPIRAQSAILMDAKTGRILYEQRADMRIPPASLTKVLSMYVALNAVSGGKKSLQRKVTVSRAAAGTRGSRLGLRAGDKVTLDKLLYGMAVASGNDASVAVAEYVAGSQSAFVRRMNAQARRIGMSRSTFANVHGLPVKGQFTTARDMMKLARAYEAHYPRARRYHLEPSVTYRGKTEPNHNPLVSWYPGINGLKTGWINASGYNIIATAYRRGHKLIAVVLGAPNTQVRAAEAGRLLNAGFAAISKKGGSAAAELGVSAKQAKALKKSPAYAQNVRLEPKKKGGRVKRSAGLKDRKNVRARTEKPRKAIKGKPAGISGPGRSAADKKKSRTKALSVKKQAQSCRKAALKPGQAVRKKTAGRSAQQRKKAR